MKIRAEINEIKNGKTIEKVNAIKNWFFETIKLITLQLHLKEKQRDWEKEGGREEGKRNKMSILEMKEGISLQQVQTLKGL